MNGLSPVIQNDEFIKHRNARRRQISHRHDSSARRQVAFGIVVSANNDDSRMMPACFYDKMVQELKVILIASHQHSIRANGMDEVKRVGLADRASARRQFDVVACLSE